MLYDSTHRSPYRSQIHRDRTVVTRGWEGDEELAFNGDRVSFWGDEYVLERWVGLMFA